MLSLHNNSSIIIPSDFNRDDLPSDQNPQRRDSTRSMTDASTVSDYQIIDENGTHIASFSTDNSSGSPEDWAEEERRGSSSTDMSIKLYQNPFQHSSLPTSLPTTFEYHTVAPSYDNYPLDEITPKIEELDDVEELQQIKPTEAGNEDKNASATGIPASVPRKRGRPRKHPLPGPNTQIKITKGRSKTGCITCRRRKKKCDETKPAYVPLPGHFPGRISLIRLTGV